MSFFNVKTLELLTLLSSKERRQFESTVIKPHKRESLIKLYRYLKKHQELDKKELFVKVFGYKYDSKEDNLLRNELRLLNKELEQFFTDIQWQQQQQEDPDRAQLLLLQLYLDRQQAHLFEQQWRKLFKKAQEEQRYELKITLINSFFDYHTQYSNTEVDLYQQLETLLEEGLKSCTAQLQEQYKLFGLRYGFLQRNLWALNSGEYTIKEVPVHYQLLTPTENEALVTFYDLATQGCYYTTGKEKIERLQQALQQAATLQQSPRYDELKERIQNIRATLGLEYYILKRYQEADAIYRRLLEQPLLGTIRSRIGITFNYFTNLLGLEAHERAIDWYQQQETLWENIPPVYYKAQYMVCWAYHEQERYEEALALLLSHNIHQRSEAEFAYARIMLSITYSALEEHELAEREVYNLLQNIRYKTFKEHISIAYCKFIHQYYLALHSLDPDKRNTKLQQIRTDLEAMYRANLSFSSTFLYRWLVQHLEAATL